MVLLGVGWSHPAGFIHTCAAGCSQPVKVHTGYSWVESTSQVYTGCRVEPAGLVHAGCVVSCRLRFYSIGSALNSVASQTLVTQLPLTLTRTRLPVRNPEAVLTPSNRKL